MNSAPQDYRVHIAGPPGDTDHIARFHQAGRKLTANGVHVGTANGRPWVAVTITAAGPLEAATVAAHHLAPTGPLTEVMAWPASDDQPTDDAPLPELEAGTDG